MPVSGKGFLSSFADKAQSAINATPLATHFPHSGSQQSNNTGGCQSDNKSHTLEALSHQFRSFNQQYISTATAPQRIITLQKSVALAFDGVAKESKSQSKELYTWGQPEAADIRDVTDRLAYLNFVQGSLATTLSSKLIAARAPFKALRDAEATLAPRRAARLTLHNQIARIEHDQQRGHEARISELREHLKHAESEDEALEKEVDILKRRAVRDSERAKWEAVTEYAEKLLLLSQTSAPIIAALPTLPPTPSSPYTGAQATGAARASLQRALDNYKTGHINIPTPISPIGTPSAEGEEGEEDTRSFGESHKSELESIHSTPSLSEDSHTPPASENEWTKSLNNAPASIPSPPLAVAPIASPALETTAMPSTTPTVAETGLPVGVGAGGPGPASGSLKDIRSPTAGSPSGIEPYGTKWESADEEKKRLEKQERDRVESIALPQPPSELITQPNESAEPKYESAEEEKKRLERLERERVLSGGGSVGEQGQGGGKGDEDEQLPPYQDF